MIDLAHAAAVLWAGIALGVLVGVFAVLALHASDKNEVD